ncbi:hypothetical protein HKW98_06140 [Stutzerimonas urumqiensis]|uniref:hypothetical protein n=1 Tax=Stutzerimonas urumqiensis TaxID=638269 RepID=UPI003BAC5ED6
MDYFFGEKTASLSPGAVGSGLHDVFASFSTELSTGFVDSLLVGGGSQNGRFDKSFSPEKSEYSAQPSRLST